MKKRIKILFFIETIDGGGAEKVLRNLVNNMDQNRFDITVQTVWPCNPKDYLVSGIRYKSMYSKRNRLNTIFHRMEAASGLAYTIHIKANYDIECAYLECGATKILSSSTNKKAVKLAWVHCDLKKLMPDAEKFAKETKKYYEKYDKVICVSEIGRQSFQELFPNSISTEIIYNTVDCEEIINKANELLEANNSIIEPLVVSLGRLSTPKHYIRLVKAHKRLIDEGIIHKLLILGEGPDRKKLEYYIKQNHLEESVFLPGFKQNPYKYLKKADLLACSSIYECFSTFITEGLILGKPIVTTDVSGMRELLGASEYGLITENDDEDFYQGMKKMLMDENFRKMYAEKAILRGQSFSTDKLVRDTEQFFVDSLKDKR